MTASQSPPLTDAEAATVAASDAAQYPAEVAEAKVRAEIERRIKDEAAVWEVQFDAGPGLVVSVSDASFVAARAAIAALDGPR